MYAEPHTGPVHGHRKRKLTSVLVAFALLSISLGCITAQVAFNITPASEGVADVKFTYTQDLSDDYVGAAKRANVELQQDYAQAGQPAPATLFPESWTEMSAAGDPGLPDPNMTITREDEHGYTAEADYAVSAGSDTPDFWNLTIGDVDEDGTQRYIFEVSTPEFAEDFDYAEFVRSRDAPMPPKPPVVRDDADDGGGGLAGLMAAVQAIMEGTISELGIEGWYLLRISKEVDLPVYTYKIAMPGEITAHTINGQTVGTVDSSGNVLTLAIDDAHLTAFGTGPKWIRVESQVSQCDAQCSAYPNMVWDKSAPGPGCTCICEAGYESDDRGDCVACDQVCAAYDPLAVYDPTDSRPNQCGCKCTGDFMEFAWGESDGACRCIAGAERKGSDCVCKNGYVKSTDGTSCVPGSSADPIENCPAGTNCVLNPDECTCGNGTICDPIGGHGDTGTHCSEKIAYIMISTGVTPYQRQWLHNKINAIRTFYRDVGYTTFTVVVNGPDMAVDFLAPPSTRAIAYFGHAGVPSVEKSKWQDLSNRILRSAMLKYAALGVPRDRRQELAQARAKQLDLQYAYMHTCHSADDMSLRDYFVGSGGKYWGHEGVLWGPQALTSYHKP